MWLQAVLAVVLAAPVAASPGDASPPYQECTAACRTNHGCPQYFVHFAWTTAPCFWCRYECMWMTVEMFEKHGYSVPQFHGKWPFISTLWAQEPASMVFSLLNLWSVNEMRKKVGAMASLELKGLWTVYTQIGIVTWLFSAWFHCADHWTSERADYFSAFAFVLFALYTALIFCFSIFRQTVPRVVLSVVMFVFYVRHVSNLLVRFDYGHNMLVCISSSICTLVCYIVYVLRRWRRFGGISGLRASDRKLLLLLTWTIASVSMEVLDFVPLWFSVDSHALFHAATIPLPLLTAHFLALTEAERGGVYSKMV